MPGDFWPSILVAGWGEKGQNAFEMPDAISVSVDDECLGLPHGQVTSDKLRKSPRG